MDTIIRWTAVIATAGFVYWYYFINPNNKRGNVSRTSRTAGPIDTVKAAVSGSDDSSLINKAKNKVKKRKDVPKQQATIPEPATYSARDDTKAAQEEELSNAQFANMMNAARTGTSFQSTAKKSDKPKTVKQSKLNAPNGASDADDDLSPAMSPTLASSGVADMLEPAKAGPSSLSIKSSEKPVSAKTQQKPKEALAPETKKQRQNREKKEAQKAVNQELEKARRVAEENQRRTAREARGEPAKNGIPVAPANNAWTASNGPKIETSAGPALTVNDFLDTFDNTPAPSANGTTVPTIQKSLPTEEEQQAWAEEDTPWATVSSKKSKKKTVAAPMSDESAAEMKAEKAAPAPTPTPVAAPKVSTTNGYKALGAFTPSIQDNDDGWAV